MFTYSVRQARDIAVVDLGGRMAADERSSIAVHDLIRQLMHRGSRNILLNLRDVDYVDSSGIGELFGCVTTVQSQGGVLKLSSPSERVSNLLRLTMLNSVIEVFDDESSAIQSFSRTDAEQNAMFARLVEGTAKPGKRDEITSILTNELLPVLKKQQGFVEAIGLFSDTSPSEGAALMLWKTKVDAESFYKSPEYIKMIERVTPLMMESMRIRTFNVETSASRNIAASKAA